ncbi:MAG: PEP/pyruvate-binding domain-containing protein [Clostridia bacterium]|nr:PEP/pyruvate-binding domain-containing protein [Clostridia bacterium]
MRAFERVNCGIKSMDSLLDNIRLGDNVVIQVSHLKDYSKIANLFVIQSIKDGKSVNYIRFASHEAVLEEQKGIKIYTPNPNSGFESFTMEVRRIIESNGYDAFYIFDCLSDLQAIWSTDLMMGNFFCVTCPYLFQLNTVAYFPILRGHHDYSTIARIQNTTQLLLDIYSQNNELYLHPIKVWNRYSPDMFLPHKLDDSEDFIPLVNSIDLNNYYSLIQKEQSKTPLLNIDSYERFFIEIKQKHKQGTISNDDIDRVIKSMMTHDEFIETLIKKNFSCDDLFYIKERMIGTGSIGGKACGMLLARKIIHNDNINSEDFLEPHDSFYIGTDVFYSFLVENNLWSLHIMQQKDEYYFEKAYELKEAILNGIFPGNIRSQFRRMLEYFGQIPIIVRSSSFLEDGFKSAFAGKYDSVFCASKVDPIKRLERFEDAIRRVYASMMSTSVLEYRKKRQMDKTDEQMAILVQRVSGTKFDNYYMPCVAGIGFSYSLYRWSAELNPNAGMLRLVAGLGTKAVDRTGYDYPRLVNLDVPEKTTLVTDEEKHRYSQRFIDVIDLDENKFTEIDFEKLLLSLPKWYTDLIFEHDRNAEANLRDSGIRRNVLYISCHNVVKNKKLMEIMSYILAKLQQVYSTPVDIEFTVNFSPEGNFQINLVQCRPLYIWKNQKSITIPEHKFSDILFKSHNTFMGNKPHISVDTVIYVEARKYHELSYKKKSSVASAVGKINKYYKNSNKTVLLLTPGRIGTSSNEFGLTVSFAEISNFKIICEYTDKKAGFFPEFSFGSHMFQDLVENEFFYIALDDNADNILNTDSFIKLNDITSRFSEDINDYECIRIYENDLKTKIDLYADFDKRICVLLRR